LGLALVSDGTELYGSYKNAAVNSPAKYTTGGAVTANLDKAFSTGLADIDKGSTLFGVLASGTVESLALNNGGAVSLGNLSGAGTVGLEVIPTKPPPTLSLITFVGSIPFGDIFWQPRFR